MGLLFLFGGNGLDPDVYALVFVDSLGVGQRSLSSKGFGEEYFDFLRFEELGDMCSPLF